MIPISCSTPPSYLSPTTAVDGDDTFHCFQEKQTKQSYAELHCPQILFVREPNLTNFGKDYGVQLFSDLLMLDPSFQLLDHMCPHFQASVRSWGVSAASIVEFGQDDFDSI